MQTKFEVDFSCGSAAISASLSDDEMQEHTLIIDSGDEPYAKAKLVLRKDQCEEIIAALKALME